MSTSHHEQLFADPVQGCVVDFLDKDGIDAAAYTCSRCNVVASRVAGIIFTAEDTCENLLFDSQDHDFSD